MLKWNIFFLNVKNHLYLSIEILHWKWMNRTDTIKYDLKAKIRDKKRLHLPQTEPFIRCSDKEKGGQIDNYYIKLSINTTQLI